VIQPLPLPITSLRTLTPALLLVPITLPARCHGRRGHSNHSFGYAQIRRSASRCRQAFVLGLSRLRPRSESLTGAKSLPNDPLPFLLGRLYRSTQSRWDESTKNFERAIELDPQNSLLILQQISRSYQCLRRYADAETALDRAVALVPKDTACELHVRDRAPMACGPPPPHLDDPGNYRRDSREAVTIAEFWLEDRCCERDFRMARFAASCAAGGRWVSGRNYSRFRGLV